MVVRLAAFLQRIGASRQAATAVEYGMIACLFGVPLAFTVAGLPLGVAEKLESLTQLISAAV